MSFKGKIDGQFRTQLKSFFALATNTACETPAEAANAFESAINGTGGRITHGMPFQPDEDREKLHHEIVNRCVSLLGPKNGDEAEVSNALWQAWIDGEDDETRLSIFLQQMDHLSSSSVIFLAPNRNFKLPENVDHMKIGPVNIISGPKAVEHLNKDNTNPHWSASTGAPGSIIEEGKIVVGVFDPCWWIEVNASKNNAKEEGAWLASIATSLLRVTAHHTFDRRLPNYDDVEPDPIHRTPTDDEQIIINDMQLRVGGKVVHPAYFPTPATLDFCASPTFQQIASTIFSPPANSLAARVAQGLGWLARGRQAKDKAERFLYFFTALEAILSTSDKSAPVVQTISRNAACILSDIPHERASNAKIIKDLYTKRSQLVHAGSRVVSKYDTRVIHFISENIFYFVIRKFPVGEKLQKFHDELNIAGYGTPWRDEAIDLLDPTNCG